ncbi:MAG: glycogen synthase GlgA [Syntrophomonadaceae bacterium]|nr:glycogen synthase GlgA [Syntrophomonadaceae bacterium]
MQVLFAAAEASPLVKTGGLGDVAYALPAALKKLGVEIRIIVPKYSAIPENIRREAKPLARFYVPLAWRNQYCGLEELDWDGLKYYLLDNEYYFKRDHLYGYYDEAERFAFFCLAARASLAHLGGFKPDILHCNDWHTALMPLLLKVAHLGAGYANSINTVLTIHNLKYQGIFPREVLGDIIGLGDEYFTPDKMEFHGAVNYLKTGLVYADCLTTVSPTYAQEIQTPFLGEGLDGILRAKKDRLQGILNGIDYSKYNPETDPHVFFPYRGSLYKKEENKLQLQSLLGLPVARGVPLLGIVSRLVEQKGWDLLAPVLNEILALDLQIAVLGTGEKKYEEMFNYFAASYPQKLAARFTFNEELAHQIYAGADLFLMPSRFEPCGLSQMIAMRYGTVPLVRETGGLKDTVIPYNQYTGEGNGFSFANYNAHELLFTVQRAVKIYREEKAAWKGLVQNALQADFSQEKSAQKYLAVYQQLGRTRVAND